MCNIIPFLLHKYISSWVLLKIELKKHSKVNSCNQLSGRLSWEGKLEIKLKKHLKVELCNQLFLDLAGVAAPVQSNQISLSESQSARGMLLD